MRAKLEILEKNFDSSLKISSQVSVNSWLYFINRRGRRKIKREKIKGRKVKFQNKLRVHKVK